ncbi:MAG: hypothetical protein KGV44_05510 [Flavobacteriaceae bacterium]|nr:hypothetical protein [Flavobacteriaceae bacterium]
MINNIYTSFESLEKELEIAKLQKDIDIQRLKNKFTEIKEQSKEDAKPKNMLQKIGYSIIDYRSDLFQLLLGYGVKRLLLRKRKK